MVVSPQFVPVVRRVRATVEQNSAYRLAATLSTPDPRSTPDRSQRYNAAMSNRAILAMLVLVGVVAAAVGIAQGPQGQRPQGAPGARPGADREPEFPIPNIREYKPESTLIVPQHPVPRAKFPAIDFHGHPPQLTSVEALAAV